MLSPMKKLLAIVVLGLFLSTNAQSDSLIFVCKEELIIDSEKYVNEYTFEIKDKKKVIINGNELKYLKFLDINFFMTKINFAEQHSNNLGKKELIYEYIINLKTKKGVKKITNPKNLNESKITGIYNCEEIEL